MSFEEVFLLSLDAEKIRNIDNISHLHNILIDILDKYKAVKLDYSDLSDLLDSEMERKDEKIRELELEIKKYSDLANGALPNKTDIENELASAKAEIERLKSKEKNDNNDDLVESLISEVDKLRADLQGKEKNEIELNKTISDLKLNYECEFQKFTSQIECYKVAQDHYENDMNELKRKLQDSDGGAANAKVIGDMENQMKEFKKYKKTCKAAIIQLQKENTSLKDEIASLKEALANNSSPLNDGSQLLDRKVCELGEPSEKLSGDNADTEINLIETVQKTEPLHVGGMEPGNTSMETAKQNVASVLDIFQHQPGELNQDHNNKSSELTELQVKSEPINTLNQELNAEYSHNSMDNKISKSEQDPYMDQVINVQNMGSRYLSDNSNHPVENINEEFRCINNTTDNHMLLIQENERLKTELAKLTQSYQKLNVDFEIKNKLLEESDNLNEEIQRLNLEYQNQNKEINEKNNEILLFKEENNRLREDILKLTNEKEYLEGEFNNIKQLKEEVEIKNKLLEESNNLSEENGKLYGEIELLNSERDKLITLNNTLTIENTGLKTEVEDMTRKLEQATSKLDENIQNSSQIEKLKMEAASSQKETEELLNEIAKLNSINDEHEKQLLDLKNQLSVKDTEILKSSELQDNEIKRLAEELEKQKSINISLDNDNKNQKEQIFSFNTELDALRVENQRLHENLSHNEQEIVLLKQNLDKYKEEESQLNASIETYKTEIMNQNSKISDLEYNIAKATSNEGELESRLSSVIEEKKQLQESLTHVNDNYGKGQNELNGLRSMLEALKNNIEDKENEIANLLKSKQESSDFIEQIKAQLIEKETHITELTSDINESNIRAQELQYKIDELNAEVAKLQEKNASIETLKKSNEELLLEVEELRVKQHVSDQSLKEKENLTKLLNRSIKSDQRNKKEIDQLKSELMEMREKTPFSASVENEEKIIALQNRVNELEERLHNSKANQDSENRCKKLSSMLEKSNQLYSQLLEEHQSLQAKMKEADLQGKFKKIQLKLSLNTFEVKETTTTTVSGDNSRVKNLDDGHDVMNAYLRRVLLQFFMQDDSKRLDLIRIILSTVNCTEAQIQAAEKEWDRQNPIIERTSGFIRSLF